MTTVAQVLKFASACHRIYLPVRGKMQIVDDTEKDMLLVMRVQSLGLSV